jgi:hypothetical protein
LANRAFRRIFWSRFRRIARQKQPRQKNIPPAEEKPAQTFSQPNFNEIISQNTHFLGFGREIRHRSRLWLSRNSALRLAKINAYSSIDAIDSRLAH